MLSTFAPVSAVFHLAQFIWYSISENNDYLQTLQV